MWHEAAMLIWVGLKDKKSKTYLKAEFSTFKEEIKKEMEEVVKDLKKDIDQRLTETTLSLTEQEKMENWNIEAKQALLQSRENDSKSHFWNFESLCQNIGGSFIFFSVIFPRWYIRLNVFSCFFYLVLQVASLHDVQQ